MVRAVREELGTSQGTVKWVANQLGYGVESVRGVMGQEGRGRRRQHAGDHDRGAGADQAVRAGEPAAQAREPAHPEVLGDFLCGGARPQR